MPHNPKSEPRPHSGLFYVLLGAALLVLIKTFSVLAPILFSLLLILLIVLAVSPVISRLRTWTGGRKLPAVLLAGGVIVFIALTGWAFVVPLKTSFTKLGERLPGYWERLQKPLIKMEQQAGQTEAKLQAEVSTEAAQETPVGDKRPAAAPGPPSADAPSPEAPSQSGFIRASLSQMLQGVSGGFKAAAGSASQMLIVFVTVFFGVTFTLMDPRPIFEVFFLIVPARHHAQTLTILQRIGKFIPTWALGTLLAMLTVGLLVFVIMLPFFGFLDALVLGLVAGVFEAIPYLGPILSAVPAVLFAFGEGGMTPVWVLLAYLGVQALENNVIAPLIMARSMKLHPVAVIFSMLLCVEVFGVLGVLVAPPLVGIVKILHDELYRKRYLATVTDPDLDQLAGRALAEKSSVPRDAAQQRSREPDGVKTP